MHIHSKLVTALGVSALVAAALVGSSGLASAANSYAAPCTVQQYDNDPSYVGKGKGWKGKGDNPYNDGKTTYRDRTIALRTSPIDRSSGWIMSGRRAGDTVWVDITHDGGKTWQMCGLTDGDTTPWYQHGTVEGRWMRVCIKLNEPPGLSIKCADVGDRTGPDGGKWWYDER